MTGAAMLGLIQQLRMLAQDGLARVQALAGLLRAPWWASAFPPAMWYVLLKSASLETQLYLAREELEKRFSGALTTLDAAQAQAEALGDNVGNPTDLLALQAQLTEDQGDAIRLAAVVDQAQAGSDKFLKSLPDAATEAADLPLKIFKGAGWLAKWGPWLVALLIAAFLVYAWKVGGVKKAATEVKEAVS